MLKCLMPDPIPAVPRLGVSETLESAAQLFKRALLKCLPAMMVGALFAEAAEIYWLATGHAQSTPLQPRDGTYYWILFFGTSLYMLVGGAVLLQLRAVHGNAHRPWNEVFGQALRRWHTLLIALVMPFLFIAVLGMVGTMLRGSDIALVAIGIIAIAGAMWFMIRLPLLMPVLMLEPVSVFDGYKRSFRLIRPIWTKVLACLVIGTLVVFVCMIVAGVLLALIGMFTGQASAGANALRTTCLLLVVAAVQLFAYCLTLMIYTSASASA